MTTVTIQRKWHTTAEVAEMLGFGLSKTKALVLNGEIRSVKREACQRRRVHLPLQERLRRLRLGHDPRGRPKAEVRLRQGP